MLVELVKHSRKFGGSVWASASHLVVSQLVTAHCVSKPSCIQGTPALLRRALLLPSMLLARLCSLLLPTSQSGREAGRQRQLGGRSCCSQQPSAGSQALICRVIQDPAGFRVHPVQGPARFGVGVYQCNTDTIGKK